MKSTRVKYITDILAGACYAMSQVPEYKIPTELLASITRTIIDTNKVNLTDIRNGLESILTADQLRNSFNDGDVLIYISPLGFINSYEYDGKMSDVVSSICSIFTEDRIAHGVAIEYVRLLHDIAYNLIKDDNDILEILPELDVNQSEVVIDYDAKNVFFASMWSFIFSESYMDALNRAMSFDNCPISILAVTGALAGLYFGIEDIPIGWINNFINEFLHPVEE